MYVLYIVYCIVSNYTIYNIYMYVLYIVYKVDYRGAAASKKIYCEKYTKMLFYYLAAFIDGTRTKYQSFILQGEQLNMAMLF